MPQGMQEACGAKRAHSGWAQGQPPPAFLLYLTLPGPVPGTNVILGRTFSYLINPTLGHCLGVTSCPWSVLGTTKPLWVPFAKQTLSAVGQPQGWPGPDTCPGPTSLWCLSSTAPWGELLPGQCHLASSESPALAGLGQEPCRHDHHSPQSWWFARPLGACVLVGALPVPAVPAVACWQKDQELKDHSPCRM